MPVRLELPAAHPHVAVVTLDRPERANALDPAMLVELAAAWRRIAEDAEIRCAVLTGAGERAFCSPAWTCARRFRPRRRWRAASASTTVDFEGLRERRDRHCSPASTCGVPLVCAVNGHARAGGFDLMLASEIRFAAPHATFALEEVALGLYPTGNASVLLPRQIGWVHAHELLLTAPPIDAERALAIGLLNRIVPPDRAAADARSPPPTRSPPTRRSPSARRARACASCCRCRSTMPIARQEELGRPLRRTEDAREAQRAFVEKRKPVWKGR